MKIYKKIDRITKTRDFIKEVKDSGGRIGCIGRVWNPEKPRQETFKVYIFSDSESTRYYFLASNEGYIVSDVTDDYNELLVFLQEKGYNI